MIYGVIDRESKRYYTYLKDVFSAIDDRQLDYNWLITDTEIYAHSEELDSLNTGIRWKYENGKPIAVPAPEYRFLSGEELTRIVKNDDSQWVWGVLSGFDKTIRLDDILTYPLPKANGYSGFWKAPPSIQHPLASIEIVPWDSSLILFFSNNKAITDCFKAGFPKCRDLPEDPA